jgi:hypothetical protein
MALINYRITTIIIVIVLILYILYTLKYKQRAIIDTIDENTIESFTVPDEAINEFDALASKYVDYTTIQGVPDKYTDRPLHEYCIKSSYNSACSGKYVSTSMVKHVLKRGCRFLDFEVFYIKDKNLFVPKVAVSSDSNYILLDSKNSISLDEVLSTISTSAFSQTSPNANDPVFINLRIKSRDTAVYTDVAKSIAATLKSVAYTGDITKDTKLKDIMRKAVVVIDKTIQPDYKEYSTCKKEDSKCYDISNYTHLESGSEYLNKYHFTDILNQCNKPVMVKDDNIHTTAENMKMAVPDIITSLDNPSNPAMKEFIIKHGCQNVFYQYQTVDKNLKQCETFFNSVKAGILPLSSTLSYYSQSNIE